jgi:hypothetical protein
MKSTGTSHEGPPLDVSGREDARDRRAAGIGHVPRTATTRG